MRLSRPFLFAAIALFLTAAAAPVFAQSDDDDAAKKKKDAEWETGGKLNLPGPKNPGPCPYAKVLYDADRYIEFKNGQEALANVGYTGEIQDLTSGCLYKSVGPIHMEMQVLFAFGRGPQATASTKTYRYWIALTDRNRAVIDKQYFDITAKFPQGADRVLMTDNINNISIPRASSIVSGANYEILVGFDVTPEMADFNREGKRFHVNASAATAANPPASPPSP